MNTCASRIPNSLAESRIEAPLRGAWRMASQIRSTKNVCTPPGGRLRARASRAEPVAAVSASRGTFGWAGYGRVGRRERARATGPPAALSVHARLRRIGFALLCRQPELRADPGARADALKRAAARRRLDYNGRIVSAAGAAGWALWRRRWPEAAVVARPCWDDSSGQ